MALDVLNRNQLTGTDQVSVRNTDVGHDRDSLMALDDFLASQVEVNADSSHALAIANKTVIMTKGSASAFTLAAPVAGSGAGGQDGTIMRFVAGSAQAHVITATGLIQDGITGGAKNTATFGAFLGSSLTLVAYNATWYVLAKNVCTIA